MSRREACQVETAHGCPPRCLRKLQTGSDSERDIPGRSNDAGKGKCAVFWDGANNSERRVCDRMSKMHDGIFLALYFLPVYPAIYPGKVNRRPLTGACRQTPSLQ